jgi:serine/threonine protein kinase/formylglycine-generating enzyme required for sulfatase activity
MSDLSGQILNNRYRVLNYLGGGGMADVFQVWDEKRSTHLAMKVLKPDLAEDRVFLRRFKHEAETLAKLKHPAIVRIYDLEEQGALAFILMDWIDGVSLRREIKETGGPFLPQRILEIMQPICGALEYAHRMGVVHCDIKPANILIDKTGRPFLSDFGIARMVDRTSTSTTLVGAGTPDYMSPEQIMGEAVRPAMDIYALGILLFMLVTGGERPFTGEQATIQGITAERVRWEHLHLPAPSPRSYNPLVPVPLEAVILRCIEKDPGRRFASAMELFGALETVLVWMQSQNLPLAPKAASSASSGNVSNHAGIGGLGLGDAQRREPPVQPTPRIPAWVWMIAAGLGISILFLVWILGQNKAAPILPSVVPSAVSPTILPKNTQTLPGVATMAPSAVPSLTFTAAPTFTLTPNVIAVCSASQACQTVGQTCRSPKDGMVMACVPNGTFTMGADRSRVLSALPEAGDEVDMGEYFPHQVNLTAYWIDQTEVTNAMFQKFVSATGYRTSAETDARKVAYTFSYAFVDNKEYPYWREMPGIDWRHPFNASNALTAREDDYPVGTVSWLDAQAYCQWAEKSLPSEAQWEKAARGSTNALFPWGSDTLDNPRANFGDQSLKTNYANSSVNDGFEYSAPVKSFPKGASAYQVYDLAGNVMEWVEDAFDPAIYRSSAVVTNPKGVAPAGANEGLVNRVFRGGGWASVLADLRSTGRTYGIALSRRTDLGFRCAISVR